MDDLRAMRIERDQMAEKLHRALKANAELLNQNAGIQYLLHEAIQSSDRYRRELEACRERLRECNDDGA